MRAPIWRIMKCKRKRSKKVKREKTFKTNSARLRTPRKASVACVSLPTARNSSAGNTHAPIPLGTNCWEAAIRFLSQPLQKLARIGQTDGDRFPNFRPRRISQFLALAKASSNSPRPSINLFSNASFPERIRPSRSYAQQIGRRFLLCNKPRNYRGFMMKLWTRARSSGVSAAPVRCP